MSEKKKFDNTIQNINNYFKSLDEKQSIILSQYIGLIQQYILHFCESIDIKNIGYMKYVINNGVDVLTHVFRILLLYTNNLKLTVYHCEKSLYYYTEFIGQIGDDNHSFLKLNSKDASLFVYKKTIFEINNECKTIKLLL